ncbi:uncharacterized protein METZ01_LOCUS290098 [marine metagenome]|uniref:Uncharacterized protein n=1 Tax=marine metagenome TaxID=408172 RepID=A0A382LK86_9ZZZZ
MRAFPDGMVERPGQDMLADGLTQTLPKVAIFLKLKMLLTVLTRTRMLWPLFPLRTGQIFRIC